MTLKGTLGVMYRGFMRLYKGYIRVIWGIRIRGLSEAQRMSLRVRGSRVLWFGLSDCTLNPKLYTLSPKL